MYSDNLEKYLISIDTLILGQLQKDDEDTEGRMQYSGEVRTLHKLASDPNIIIRKADKGEIICILDLPAYCTEVLSSRHLGDPATYLNLTSDRRYRLDPEKALKMQLIRNHGECLVDKFGVKNIVNVLGVNYRMPNIEAAITRVQFKKLKFLNEYRINSAFPNPFNPIVTITYQLTGEVLVEGVIFDIRGKKITTLFSENQSAGKKVVTWDGKNQDGLLVSAGVYYFRLSSGSITETIKLSMIK